MSTCRRRRSRPRASGCRYGAAELAEATGTARANGSDTPALHPVHPSPRPPQWLLFLSGLTCTEDNFMQKAGAQRAASQHGVAIVAPDTSPRGLNVPGEADRWQFGVGAGFYLNATEPKWKNWRMYDYVSQELPALLAEHLPLVRLANGARRRTAGRVMVTPPRWLRPLAAPAGPGPRFGLWPLHGRPRRAAAGAAQPRPLQGTPARGNRRRGPSRMLRRPRARVAGADRSRSRRSRRSRTRPSARSAGRRSRATSAPTRPRGPSGTRPRWSRRTAARR